METGRRNLGLELRFLAVATLCFVAAVVALARIHFLLDQDRLTLRDFVPLLALCAGFAWLGCSVVLALQARLRGEPIWPRWIRLPSIAALFSSALGSRSDSDPSRRPPPPDSRC